MKRLVYDKLLEWKNSANRKPLLVRGARQVGKSSAVRHLGETFENFVEINLESQPSLQELFTDDIDVKQTCRMNFLWLFKKLKMFFVRNKQKLNKIISYYASSSY